MATKIMALWRQKYFKNCNIVRKENKMLKKINVKNVYSKQEKMENILRSI